MVGDRLDDLLRRSDTLARLDGDKFAVLLSAGDVPHLGDQATVAMRVCESMRNPFALNDQECFVTCSVGVALGPQDGDTPEQLMRCADLALQRAKKRGKNLFEYFSPVLQKSAMERLQLVAEMRRSLARQAEAMKRPDFSCDQAEFCLFYQPQLCLRTLKVVGFEALVRWRHPERGFLPPGAFIEAAEDSGLIVDLGSQVIELAARQISEWRAQGVEVPRVAVNVSILQFTRSKLPELVEHAIKQFGLKTGQLELEITESLLALDQQLILPQIQAICALGVPFSIDDFGTGYSSLAYLKQFPVATLKIAQQFVLPAVEQPRHAAIVRTILSMARALELAVVAEGIETSEHLEFLREAECEIGQGYFFARPLPAHDAANYFLKQRDQETQES